MLANIALLLLVVFKANAINPSSAPTICTKLNKNTVFTCSVKSIGDLYLSVIVSWVQRCVSSLFSALTVCGLFLLLYYGWCTGSQPTGASPPHTGRKCEQPYNVNISINCYTYSVFMNYELIT